MTLRSGALCVLFAGAAVGALALATAAYADDAADAGAPTLETVIVTAPSSISNLADLPNTTSTVTADQLAKTISVIAPEDTLRYVPNVLIRQRHIGDTQSPITSRTSGVGASADAALCGRHPDLRPDRQQQHQRLAQVGHDHSHRRGAGGCAERPLRRPRGPLQ